MKILGAGLVLLGAAAFLRCRRREEQQRLLLMEAIWEDLALMDYEITALNLPLPQLLAKRCESRAGRELWQPMLEYLRDMPVEESWHLAVSSLPGQLPRCLGHLGGVLTVGGGAVSRAIAETREELAGIIGAERSGWGEREKVRAALVLCAAAMLILVLI